MAPSSIIGSFVGREAAIAELSRRSEQARVVTVIGPPGVGKTRLVREFMGGREGVFVDLAGVHSRAELRARVATAFGVQLVDDNDDRLVAALAARGDSLVALVDVERVSTGVAGLVSGWVAGTSVHVILASRIRLGVDGEHLFDLPPLDVADAVVLFSDRARAVRSVDRSSPDDVSMVEKIVCRLECLPLSIELAASRMRVLSLHQLSEQLSERLDLLTQGQRSMRGALDTSWQLLSPWLREALVQCTVFRGGFSLEAARSVLRFDSDHNALDAVQALCEQSLLQAYQPAHGPGDLRYRLYESVHAFGLERLGEDAASAVRERHADYFATWASKVDSLELSLDVENLIDAHRHSLSESGHAVRALTIATALDPAIKRCGPMELRMTLLDDALDAVETAGDPGAPLIDGLLARADAASELSMFERALADRTRALELAEASGDTLREARCLAGLGRLAWHNGDIDGAETYYARALPLFEQQGDREGLALTLLTSANVHTVRGDAEHARTLYERVLSILRSSGERPDLLALALGNMANLEQNVDELEAAENHLELAIETARSCGERYYESTFLLHYAVVAFTRKHLDRAEQICERALTLQRALGNRRWEGASRTLLAEIAETRGDTQLARRGYEEALVLLRDFGHPLLEGVALCKLGRLEAVNGRFDVAERRLSQARERLTGDSALVALASICEAEIARCRGDAGSLQRARELADSATDAARHSWEVCAALARLRTELPDSVGPVLLIGQEGRWFEASEGERTDLSRRRALRLVLEALSRAQRALTIDELLEAGWPGETVTTEAGHSRVYTAIATLRRMGLRGILLRRDDGYLLDPYVTIRRGD